MTKRSELRKISAEGRVKIPPEYLRLHQIEEGDTVEVSCNSSSINIRKYREEYVCAVTGKFSKNGQFYGNSYISKEGLAIIHNMLEKKSD